MPSEIIEAHRSQYAVRGAAREKIYNAEVAKTKAMIAYQTARLDQLHAEITMVQTRIEPLQVKLRFLEGAPRFTRQG